MYCGGEEMAIGILMPGVQQYRDAARILVARAMLRIGEGKVNEAWEDLLTCHRLARLAGQGVFLIDALVAVAIDTMAFVGDQALLQSGHPSAAQVVKMRDSLANLPPMSKMVDKIDYAERFVFLDIVSLAARNGLSSITSVVTGAYRNTTPKSILIRSWIHWAHSGGLGSRSSHGQLLVRPVGRCLPQAHAI